MRKLSIGFLLSLLLSFSVSAQQYGYKKGDKLLYFGVGVNSYYDGGVPLSVSYESGITDRISAGASVDYLSSKYSIGSQLSYKFTSLYIGLRASYHVNELLGIQQGKIDLYGGLTVGYRSFNWSDNFSDNSLGSSYGSGVYLGGYIGGKYFFTPRIGAFTEVGAIGSTNARIGLALKF